MSINALGFAATAAQALPGLASIVPPSDKPKTPAEQAQARAEAAALRQKTTLDEVREKGLYKYAQEQKFKALEEKIAKEVKAERGINDNMYAAMSPEEKSSLQQEITKRIQAAMQDALTNESNAAVAEGRPPQPMIIDISV